jgi:hypothetical protein
LLECKGIRRLCEAQPRAQCWRQCSWCTSIRSQHQNVQWFRLTELIWIRIPRYHLCVLVVTFASVQLGPSRHCCNECCSTTTNCIRRG